MKGELIAELGRYAVEKGAFRDLSEREILQAVAILSGRFVKRFYVEVNEARYRRFRPLGLTVEAQSTNYAGEPEYLLSGDPERVMRRMMGDDFGEIYQFSQPSKLMLYLMQRAFAGSAPQRSP